eukprot:1867460-Pyramimonas_sp.AAC.1
MSQTVCLFSVPTSFAVGANLEDVSSEALMFTPKGSGPVRGRVVGMSQAVCMCSVPTSFAFGAELED